MMSLTLLLFAGCLMTFGADAELNQHRNDLVAQNGGLYRVAQVSATIGREALTTALTGGTTAVANGLAMSTARSIATRMGYPPPVKPGCYAPRRQPRACISRWPPTSNSTAWLPA